MERIHFTRTRGVAIRHCGEARRIALQQAAAGQIPTSLVAAAPLSRCA
jgi:hypothetical protein